MVKQMEKLFLKNFLLLSTVLFLFTACSDPIFYTISQQTKPKDPLIEGAPTSFAYFKNAVYVASGNNLWKYTGKWSKANNPGEKILQIAATTDYIYALCYNDKSSNIKTLKKMSASGTWTNVSLNTGAYNNYQDIYSANDTLFISASVEAANKSSVSYAVYFHNYSRGVEGKKLTDGKLTGAIFNGMDYYICTSDKGIFRIEGPTISPSLEPVTETFDFEYDEIGDKYSFTKGDAEPTVEVAEDPFEPTEKSLVITSTGLNQAAIVPINLPFALENYETFKFKYSPSTGIFNNAPIYVYISDNKDNFIEGGFGNDSSGTDPEFEAYLMEEVDPDYSVTGDWIECTIDIANIDSTLKSLRGDLYIAIGINSNEDLTYYIDDLTFDPPPTIPTPGDPNPVQISNTTSKEFIGIINLENSKKTLVSITRDCKLYTINAASASETASFDDGRLATGALAVYRDKTTNKPILLLAGRQDSLKYTTDSGYTYGYLEIEISDTGVKGSKFSEPGINNISSVFKDKDGGNAQYKSSIGKYPVNYIFHVPRGTDTNMPLFASTQKNGVWSYRYVDGKWQWNAETN